MYGQRLAAARVPYVPAALKTIVDMKQLFTLSFFFLLSLAASAQVDVTFAVDMTGQGGVDAAFVAGEFQSWTPANGTLDDSDGNGVWARTYSLAPGTYLYKFGIGADWGNNEGGGLADCGVDDNNGGFNRQITVEEGMPQTVVFLYDACDMSDLPVAEQAATVPVTFAVDVTALSDVEAVFVAGSFQDPMWQPMNGALSDDDGNGVWAATFDVVPGEYQYKFGIGNDWGNNEGGAGIADCSTDDNRTITVTEGDNPTVVYVYNSCAESNIPVEGDAPDGLVEVIFSVDMTGQTGVDAAFVAGSFQGWMPGDGALDDTDGNGIWRRSYRLMPGTNFQYKFGIGSDWGNNEGDGLADCGLDDGNGGFNRDFTIPEDAEETIYLSFEYNSCMAVDVTSTDNVSTLGNVRVAPNPMGAFTRISFGNVGNDRHDVSLVNMAGQTVRTYQGIRGNQLDVERGNLAPGLYFVTFRNDRGEVGSLKLVVR